MGLLTGDRQTLWTMSSGARAGARASSRRQRGSVILHPQGHPTWANRMDRRRGQTPRAILVNTAGRLELLSLPARSLGRSAQGLGASAMSL